MRDRDDKKRALLEAGTNLMRCKGYHGTGIQQIVDAAGVPKGSFYNYFKSKTDFVLAAMEHTSRRHISAFEEALLNGDRPPGDRIVSAFEKMTDAYIREKDFTKGCFVGNMCQEMADTIRPVAEKAEYLFRNYTTALARCIRALQQEDDTRQAMDADKLAEFIFNSWEGALMRMKASRSPQPLTAFRAVLACILLA